jgi:quercetin dioxygenase-like cupin family protein
MAESDGIVRTWDEGQTAANPLGGSVTFKALARETGEALTTFESSNAPGEGPPLHVHPAHDETIYVLEGSVRFRVGEEVRVTSAGSFAYFPRGTPHTWQNVGEVDARLLVAFVPGAPGMEGFFGGVADADAAPAAEIFRTVPSGDEMEIVGPPLAQSHPL